MWSRGLNKFFSLSSAWLSPGTQSQEVGIQMTITSPCGLINPKPTLQKHTWQICFLAYCATLFHIASQRSCLQWWYLSQREDPNLSFQLNIISAILWFVWRCFTWHHLTISYQLTLYLNIWCRIKLMCSSPWEKAVSFNVHGAYLII